MELITRCMLFVSQMHMHLLRTFTIISVSFASVFSVAVATVCGGLLTESAQADTPQTFKATIGGASFDSDDDSIRFIPLPTSRESLNNPPSKALSDENWA